MLSRAFLVLDSRLHAGEGAIGARVALFELADLVFDELMGTEVEGRKKWIMANADKAALDI